VQVCLELQQTWMESGVSEDAVSGHIQVCHAHKPYTLTMTLTATLNLPHKHNSILLQACRRALHPLLGSQVPQLWIG